MQQRNKLKLKKKKNCWNARWERNLIIKRVADREDESEEFTRKKEQASNSGQNWSENRYEYTGGRNKKNREIFITFGD